MEEKRQKHIKLLIHHHAPVFINPQGDIYVQSFIGSWVQELSHYFEQVGLLLTEIERKSTKQDYQITADNVKIHLLPQNLGGKNRLKRYMETMKVCKNIEEKYDLLLIRGITPKQFIVYRSFKNIKKAYLLVGSIEQSKPKFTLFGLFKFFMWYMRRRELKTIVKGSEMFGNSPILVQEIYTLTGKLAKYLPTNTISLGDFEDVKRDDNKRKINLLFIGRVSEDKGILDLIRAFDQLFIRGVDFTLTIVGPYTEEMKNKIESLVSNDKRELLSLQGYIPFGKQLFEYYKKSDIYILPSYHEGFPHTIWEAAAFNLPIITTKVGGIPGIVSNSHVYFINIKNELDIQNSIGKVLSDNPLRKRKINQMSILTKENSVEKSTEKMADHLTNLIT